MKIPVVNYYNNSNNNSINQNPNFGFNVKVAEGNGAVDIIKAKVFQDETLKIPIKRLNQYASKIFPEKTVTLSLQKRENSLYGTKVRVDSESEIDLGNRTLSGIVEILRLASMGYRKWHEKIFYPNGQSPALKRHSELIREGLKGRSSKFKH